MSLLLNALRRASTARQAKGEATGSPPGAAGDADTAGPPAAGSRSNPDPPADGFELEDVPDEGRPIPWPAASADQAVARAVLGRPRGASGRLWRRLALALAGLFGVALLALAGWYTLRATQRGISAELARFDPAPAQAPSSEVASASADAQSGAPAEPDQADAATPGSAVASQEPAPAGGQARSQAERSGSGAASDAEQRADGGADRSASPQAGTAQAGSGRAGDADAPASNEDNRGGGEDDRGATEATAETEPSATPTSETEPRSDEADGAANEVSGSTGDPGTVVRASDATPLRDALQTGYRALQAGELERAGDAYERALRLAPNNRDALIGAAAVAQRQGQPERARRMYRRILADQPKDPYARAALAAMSGRTAARRTESQLKTLLQDNPSSPALHFALGNVYARESRWSEAQQAYFEAVRAAPEHPDYAYNLAVALDHLGQRDAAERHYARALRLAEGRAAAFDREAARRRLDQLRR